jgi:hypothetical protein
MRNRSLFELVSSKNLFSEWPVTREGFCYTLTETDHVSCDLDWSCFQGFPRNAIYVTGARFQVSGLTCIKRNRPVDSVEIIVIPLSVEILNTRFLSRGRISLLAFESHSQLRQIDTKTFASCSNLRAICLPASIEILSTKSFFKCVSLSTISFERGFKLSQIGECAFMDAHH